MEILKLTESNRFVAYKPLSYQTEYTTKETKNKCWHCCYPINGYAIPRVFSYNSLNDTFETVGQYCSFCCSASDTRNRNENVSLLKMMFMRYYNHQIVEEWFSRIHGGSSIYAPPKQVLTDFGGHMSIEEYRGSFGLGVNVEILVPPLYKDMMVQESFGKGVIKQTKSLKTVAEPEAKRVKSAPANEKEQQRDENLFKGSQSISDQLRIVKEAAKKEEEEINKNAQFLPSTKENAKRQKKSLLDYMKSATN